MTPSEQIDQLIAATTDWRGETLAVVRKTILEADPAIVEEWKWMGSPVWSRAGMIAVGNPHKEKVKLTFSHGASLPDPDKLFNLATTARQLLANANFSAYLKASSPRRKKYGSC